jgi:hypothetical protein
MRRLDGVGGWMADGLGWTARAGASKKAHHLKATGAELLILTLRRYNFVMSDGPCVSSIEIVPMVCLQYDYEHMDSSHTTEALPLHSALRIVVL